MLSSNPGESSKPLKSSILGENCRSGEGRWCPVGRYGGGMMRRAPRGSGLLSAYSEDRLSDLLIGPRIAGWHAGDNRRRLRPLGSDASGLLVQDQDLDPAVLFARDGAARTGDRLVICETRRIDASRAHASIVGEIADDRAGAGGGKFPVRRILVLDLPHRYVIGVSLHPDQVSLVARVERARHFLQD